MASSPRHTSGGPTPTTNFPIAGSGQASPILPKRLLSRRPHDLPRSRRHVRRLLPRTLVSGPAAARMDVRSAVLPAQCSGFGLWIDAAAQGPTPAAAAVPIPCNLNAILASPRSPAFRPLHPWRPATLRSPSSPLPIFANAFIRLVSTPSGGPPPNSGGPPLLTALGNDHASAHARPQFARATLLQFQRLLPQQRLDPLRRQPHRLGRLLRVHQDHSAHKPQSWIRPCPSDRTAASWPQTQHDPRECPRHTAQAQDNPQAPVKAKVPTTQILCECHPPPSPELTDSQRT